MAKKDNKAEGMEKVDSAVSRTENWFENNSKKIITAFAAIVVIAIGIILYYQFVRVPRNAEASTELYKAEFEFARDSFNLALNGIEGEFSGFATIVEEYGSSPAGNAARYYAGVCCMRLGEFENAINYLEDFSSDEPFIGSQAVALIGDANMELGNNDKAVSYYMKAADMANNTYLTPMFLIKAGNTYELLGNYKEALNVYKRVQDEFYTTLERTDKTNIEKYIQRAELKLNK